MPTGNNDFVAFATTGPSPNVDSEATFTSELAAGGSLQNGFQANTNAPSSTCNKLWRQSSFISAMIGGFIAQAGLNANDDGNNAEILGNFIAALKKTVFSAYSLNNPGYVTLSMGLILQWGTASFDYLTNLQTVALPVAWPNGILFGVMSDRAGYAYQYGVGAGTDNAHISCFCPTQQIENGTIRTRSVTATGAFLVGGY